MTAAIARPRPPRASRFASFAAAGACLAASGCAELDGLAAELAADPAAASDPAAEPASAPASASASASATELGLAPGPYRGGPEADRGSALLAAGYADAAERAFSRSLVVEGPSAQAMVGLGAANRALGRAAAARDLLERAVSLWPGDVSARNALGAVLYDEAEYAAARAQFAMALSMIPPQDEAARLEITRNIAFADAALERDRVARAATDARATPASGPRVVPLGGGRYRIDPPEGS
ncbi:MAG: tetratricopeptide repeat protein [Pseudomonadota bacterium]